MAAFSEISNNSVILVEGGTLIASIADEMGHDWGELAKIRRVAYFRLSPHEQKPFAGAISQGVPNMLRRVRGQVLRVCPPFLMGYMVYSWAVEESKRVSRKNPKDYENNV